MATRGSTPKARAVSALLIAMSASCSADGSGFTAQSAKTRTRSGRHMRNALDTRGVSGVVRMISRAGRMVWAVVCAAPDTMPSTRPVWTRSVPK